MRAIAVLLVSALALAPLAAHAQDEEAEATATDDEAQASHDAEARAVFEAGSMAFDDSRYADALEYFQRAFELSGRPGLLYNIGVAADRLRRDQEALDAFERFLAAVPEHPRRRDVEARVEVLRAALARGEAAAASEDTHASETTPEPTQPASSGPDLLTIVGASGLGAVGLAGVIAAVVGIAGTGCIDMVGGTCVEERGTNWVGTGIYGGLGIAAIAGAVVWLVVGLSGGNDERSSVSVGPNGELRWTF